MTPVALARPARPSIARFLTFMVLAAVVAAPLTVVATATSAATALISMSKTAPERALVGGSIEYELTATSQEPDDFLFNVAFRDILPAGVEYEAGSTRPAGFGDPQIIPERDGNNVVTGRTILIWHNVSDIAPGEAVTLNFTAQTDEEILPAGAEATNEAWSYVSANERIVPRFNAQGGWVSHPAVSASPNATSTTRLTPISIDKSEPSPEQELLRGVQDNWTTYTLTLRNNHANVTDNLTVVDFLPAELEFLGCRTEDNSAADEYPGSGPLNGGGVSNCYDADARVNLVSVTTVEAPHAGLPATAAAGDVFTRVEWEIPAGLVPSEVLDIKYAAGIPLRENTMWPAGDTPAADGAQIANLDNNTGPATRELASEDSLTNYASVSGDYQGPDVNGVNPVLNVSDDTSHTVWSEDVRLVKSVDDATFVQDGSATYTLTIDVSQYVTASAFTVVDTIPDGLCFIDAPASMFVDQAGEPIDVASSELIADGCAPVAGGDASVTGASVQQVMVHPDGHYQVTFSLNDDAVGANGTRKIIYNTHMRTAYTGNGAQPTAAGDSFTNNVALEATTTPIAGNDIDSGPQVVYDESSETVGAGLPGLVKRIKPNTAANYDCAGEDFTDQVTDSPEFYYTIGSRVCFELEVPFSTSADTKNPVLVDFLPPNLEYEAGSLVEHADNNVDYVFVDGTFDADGNRGEFLLGTPQGDDRFVPLGSTFKVRFSAIVVAADATEVDIEGNLAKLRWENTAGEVHSLRRQIDFFVPPPPPVDVTKTANDEDELYSPVVHGNEVTYRIQLTHGGDPALANDVPVHDIEVWDVLPAAYQCDDVTDLGGASCTDPGEAGHPSFTGADEHSALTWVIPGPLTFGDTLDVEYTVTIPTNTSASTTYTNTAHVRTYETETNRLDSSDAPVLTPQFPANNVDTTVPADDWSVPEASDPAAVRLPSVGVDKSLTSSQNEPGNTATQAVPGEVVTYTIEAVVPARTTVYNGILRDPSIHQNLELTGASASYSADGGDNFVDLDLADFVLHTTAGTTSSASTVELEFPTEWTNSTDVDQVFRITVETTVRPGVTSHNANRANTATFTSTQDVATDSPSTPAVSDTATVNLRQPAPQISKVNNATGPLVIDDVVTFTLQLGQGNNRPPLHDWSVIDCVPAGLIVDADSLSAGSGTATVVADPESVDCGPTDTAIQWTAPTTGAGASIPANSLTNSLFTLTYTATIGNASAGGQSYVNTATLTGSTVDDEDNDSSHERVFEVEDDSVVAIQDAQLEKSVNETAATIGDEREWTITATIPANVNLFNAAIVDQLPEGVSVDGTDITFTCADDLGDDCTSDLTATPVARDGQTIGWALGTIVSHDQVRTIVITYTGHVVDTSTNNAGVALTNTAQLRWNQTPGTDPSDVTEIEELDAGSNEPTSTLTIHEPNVGIAKTVDNSTPGPGENFAYEVTVTNNSGDFVSDAFNLEVSDIVPAGVIVDADSLVVAPASAGITANLTGDDPTTGGGTITFTAAGPLAPGESLTLTYEATLAPSTELGGEGIDLSDGLTNTATVDGYESLPTGGREYDGPTADDTLTPQFPFVTIDKAWVDTDVAIVDQPSTFEITVTNTGGATAYNIDVVDTLPPNWDFTSATVSPDSVSTANPSVLTWTGLASGGLEPGGEITITYTATPREGAVNDPGTDDNAHLNVASVTAEDATGESGNGDGPYNGPPAQAEVFIHEVDLVLDKNVTGAAVAGAPAGDQGVTWTIDVTNNGPNPEVGPITVVDTLPDNFTYVGFAPTASDWTCDTPDTNGVLTCVFAGGLAANESLPQLSIIGTIPSDAPTANPLVNEATVSGTTYESEANLDDNSDDAAVDITPIADLGLVKELTSDELVAGNDATYRITVTNHGPSTSREVITITDTLPDYLEFRGFIGLDETAWDCDVVGQSITCDTGDLLAGQSRTIDLRVTVAPDHNSDVVNSATVTGTTPEGPDDEPNTSTSTEPPTRLADLALTKNHDPDVDYVAGTVVPFVMTVINHGPSTAHNVEISDALAPYLTFDRAESADGWTCSASGQDVTCRLADDHLVGTANQTQLVLWAHVNEAHVGDVENSATVSSDTTDPVLPNNDDSTTTGNIGQQADLGIEKTTITEALVAGEQVEYELTITNYGPSASGTPVTITDIVPEGLTFAGHSGDASSCAASTVDGVDVVECVVSGSIATGTANAKTIALTFDTNSDLGGTTVSNTALVEGPYDDPEPGNDQSTTTDSVTALTNLVIDKVVIGDDNVASGGQVDWTITVHNEGPSDAEDVTVDDVLPAGLTLVDVTGAGWDCADGASFPCTFGTLAAGLSTTLTVTTQVSAAEPAEAVLVNTATVSTSTPESNDDDNESSDSVTTYTEADLAITKSHTGSAVAGESLAYTLSVSNHGPSNALGPITVVDVLPAGLTFTGATAPWVCEPGDTDPQVVTCVLQPDSDGIQAGTEAPALVIDTLVAPDQAGETLPNTASVSSPTDDPNEENDEDTDTVTPLGSADLRIAKTHDADDVKVGEQFDFTIVVTNDGPSQARDVQVTDLLPAGLELIEAHGTGWTCDDAECQLSAPLAPGATTDPLTIRVSVTPATYPSVTNMATVESSTPDPDPSNNEDEDPVEVPALVDLAIEKTSDAQFKVGADGQYSFTVINNGPTPDPGPITVTDELPAGMTLLEGSGEGWECDADAQLVTCVIPDGLDVGQTIVMDLAVTVGPAAAPSVTNTATVSSPSEDTNPENNTSTVVTPVEPTALLSIAKRLASADGDAATWEITVTNEGPSATDEPLVFVDRLPNLLEYTGHSGDGWVCDIAGSAVTCTYEDSLPAGESTSVQIDTTILATDGSEIVNTVTLTSGGETSSDTNTSSASVTAPTPGGPLPWTGAAPWVWALAVAGLTLAGAGAFLVSRRRA